MSRRGLGTVTEVAPGKFVIQVSAGTDPLTGKRRRPSQTVYGKQKDADAALARMLLEVGQTPQTDVTVKQYLDQMWLPHVQTRVRARTLDGYKSKIENHITPTLGDSTMSSLDAYQLDQWLDTVKGSARTRLHAYRVLCTALNQAVKWRLITHNPLNAVEPPKVRRELPDTLTPDEANAYLDAFQGHVLEPIVVLAISAGLRRSELAGLRWADIDFNAKTVSIKRGHHDRAGAVLVEEPKSQTSQRVIALPDWAVGILWPLRGFGALVEEDGEAMRPRRISDEYTKHVEASDLRHIPMKNLRHTHATLMLAAGVDLYTVSRRLGHSTTAVTEMHYVKPGEAADRNAAAVFEALRKSDEPATVGTEIGTD